MLPPEAAAAWRSGRTWRDLSRGLAALSCFDGRNASASNGGTTSKFEGRSSKFEELPTADDLQEQVLRGLEGWRNLERRERLALRLRALSTEQVGLRQVVVRGCDIRGLGRQRRAECARRHGRILPLQRGAANHRLGM